MQSYGTVINLIHKLEFEMEIKFPGDLLLPNCHFDTMITDSLLYYNRYINGEATV